MTLDVPAKDAPQASNLFEALFAQHGELSIGEVMDLTGQSRTTVHRRLVEMVEAGFLERRGAGRASRYRRTHN
jgi:DNA-binding IclR family transcriptional regulator